MKKEELKYLYENDLFLLTKNLLGYSQLEEDPHLEVCQFLEAPEEKKLLLLPRGTFKTTIGTIARAIQAIIRNPNARILIFSETYSQSKAFLSEIKQHLERNNELIGMYGIFKNDPGWAEQAITIRQRTGKYKEDTIMTGGVDIVRVGFHYDLIIVDDPHSQKNIATREQIEKVKLAYKLLGPMLEPKAEVDVIMTRWHDADLASMLLEDPKFKKMVKAAEITQKDGSVKLFFPQRLSPQKLADEKYDLGTYLYSCQYLNKPVADEDADFKKDWFKYYTEDEIERYLLNTYITVDPAVSQKEEANFTGVVINSVDIHNNWYFRKTLKLKVKAPELIDLLFDWNHDWKPLKIGIEKEKYSLVIQPFLDEEMKKRQEYLPVEMLTPKESNKEMRIRGLTPRYERGQIYHNKEDKGRFDLEDEVLRFPKGKTDDVLDAASMQSDLIKIPKSGETKADYDQKKRGEKYKYIIRKKRR